MVGIIFISVGFRFALPVLIQETSFALIISIFFIECYIIPISYLSKLYTSLQNTKKIIQLHLTGLGLPIILAMATFFYIDQQLFLWCLMIGSAIIYLNYFWRY